MYKKIISSFKNFSLLVLGDLMLDRYLTGGSTRLAPEAPVPVVDVLSSKIVLGGAANTAINLKALGAHVTFISIVGDDNNGAVAVQKLIKAGITPHVIRDKAQITSVKTRVISENHIIVRFDVGSKFTISNEIEKEFIDLIHSHFSKFDAIVISDYNKGLFTPTVISALRTFNEKKDKFIAVDSKRLVAFRSLTPSVVKPNYLELVRLLNINEKKENRIKQVNNLGKEIFANTCSKVTAVSLDCDGAVFFLKDKLHYRCFANTITNTQTSGAGDAFFSALALSLLAGENISDAAEISSSMAAVALLKKTTASSSASELIAYLSRNEKYVDNIDQLRYIVELYKSQEKKVVFTNGCFDVLHSGHVSFLNAARSLGQILIVGLNTDASIKRIKGATRPVNKLSERLKVLSGLGAVNHVISFGTRDNDEALSLIRAIRPEIYTKGGNYVKEDLKETNLVQSLGGQVMILPLAPNRSTTRTIKRIFDLQKNLYNSIN